MTGCNLPHSVMPTMDSRAAGSSCGILREMATMQSRFGWQSTMHSISQPLPVSDPKQLLKSRLGNAVLTANPVQLEGGIAGSASLLAGYNAVLIKREFRKLKDAREKLLRDKKGD